MLVHMIITSLVVKLAVDARYCNALPEWSRSRVANFRNTLISLTNICGFDCH